jgi:hypothetical protein
MTDEPNHAEVVLAALYHQYVNQRDRKGASEYLKAALADHPEILQPLKLRHGQYATVLAARGRSCCAVTNDLYNMLNALLPETSNGRQPI